MTKKQETIEELNNHIKKVEVVVDDLVAEVYELEQEIKKKRKKA